MNKALIIVDLQNDFMPGGALAVPQGDEVVAIANRLQACFDIVIATQDWHPANHRSFAINHAGHTPGDIIEWLGLEQVLWPAHCVQGSKGAELIKTLETSRISKIVHKGTHPDFDSYSTFFDNAHRQKTDLDEYLHSRAVTDIYLLGLATDYCVKYSALDGRYLDYQTHVIIDGCRGIDLQLGDIDRAIAEMEAVGVKIVESKSILKNG